MSATQLIAACLVGLLGAVHCVGMCGGIVGALTMTLPARLRGDPAGMMPYLAAYNLGRILSYTVAGAVAGALGALAAGLGGLHRAQMVLSVLAGLFMVALGLYLGGWWRGLARVERAGASLWRRVEPLGRGLLPVSSPGRALALGLIWGWLPCGLVYSVLVWSLAAGSALQGALLMLSFGLGTLPALLALGTLASALSALVRHRPVRWSAGALVAALGLVQIGRAL